MISLVIPAYKPSESLIKLIDDIIRRINNLDKIIVVNDGSGDIYKEVFDLISLNEKCIVLSHDNNKGKGRTIKTAFEYVINNLPDTDAVVTVDADGQHTPESIQRMISDYNTNHKTDTLILGCRDFSRTTNGKKIPLRSKLGNEFTKFIFRFLCGINISDTQTGLRLYTVSVLQRMLNVPGEKYEYETNVLLYSHENGIELSEVKIDTVYEDNNSSSHFRPIRDSYLIYREIIKYSLSSLLSVIIDNSVFGVMSFFTGNIFLMTYTSRFFAAIVNFWVNKRAVFKSNGDTVKQIVKYVLLVFISGTLSACIVKFINGIFNIYPILIKVLVECILFFFNFYIQKYLVFSQKAR